MGRNTNLKPLSCWKWLRSKYLGAWHLTFLHYNSIWISSWIHTYLSLGNYNYEYTICIPRLPQGNSMLSYLNTSLTVAAWHSVQRVCLQIERWWVRAPRAKVFSFAINVTVLNQCKIWLFPRGTGLLNTSLPHHVHYHHSFSRIDSLSVT